MTAPWNRTVLLGEWRLLWRDPAAWVALVLLCLALLGALAQGLAREQALAASLAQWADTDEAHMEAAADLAQRLERDGGEISNFRDPRNADVVGRRLGVQHLALPSTRLGALAVGQSDLHPAWHPVSLESRDRLLAEGELTHPRRLALGRFDVSFVVVFIAPLLLLGLLASVPAREREAGMLPWVVMQSGGFGSWLMGRVLPRLLLLLIPVLIVGTLAPLLQMSSDGTGGEGQTLARGLLWSAQVTGYLLFWAALALWVGTLPLDGARSALALAFAWLLFVVLIPSVSQVALDLAHPQPSRMAYVDAMRSATDLARAEGSDTLARYLEDHPELAGETVNLEDFFAQRLLVQQRVEAELEPLSAAFEGQRAARARQAAWMRLTSPALLTMDALADAAGTGEARHRHFMAQVHGFHAEWRSFFHPRVLSGEQFFDHDQVPGFVYEPEPLRQLWPRSALLLGSTGGFALLFAWLALRRCRSLPKVIGQG
ncbi:MAG: DUF3526 domain-containing protein [Gammaproteobacteria bacterium]|nr:DUF3526 domain-containing protein [Gammaproteobacteria bacterium]